MWEQSESGRVSHRFEPLILAATLMMIPVIIIERDATSDGWQAFAKVANWAIWGIFAFEMIFILRVAPRKGGGPAGALAGRCIVIVTVPLYGRLLSSLRLVRLVRLLRLAQGIELSSAAPFRQNAGLTSTSTFRTVGLATVFLVVVAGAVKNDRRRRGVQDVLGRRLVGRWSPSRRSAMAISTRQRRLVGWSAIVLMLVGIGFLAVLTATISSLFVKNDREEETTEVLDALHRLEAELAELKARLT